MYGTGVFDSRVKHTVLQWHELDHMIWRQHCELQKDFAEELRTLLESPASWFWS